MEGSGPILILVIIALMVLFIPNNGEEALITKLINGYNNSSKEYSRMSNYYYGTNSHSYLMYFTKKEELSAVNSLDYDELYKVIFDRSYHINPYDLNKTLDLIDQDERIIKTGKSFRINKNFVIISDRENVQKVLNELPQEIIDTLANIALWTSESPYDDREDSRENTLSLMSYFNRNVLSHLTNYDPRPINEVSVSKAYYKLKIIGLAQQYRMYENPSEITKDITIMGVDIDEHNHS